MSRKSLFMPILIGVLAILLAAAVTVGWNIIFTEYYSLSAAAELSTGYWLILSFGDVFL